MTSTPDPLRGEIWRVDLNPTRGAEISKARPCVVINATGVGRLLLRIVVPITEWDPQYAGYSWMIRLDPDPGTGLTKPSTADAFQIRSVSLDRFLAKLGSLSLERTDQIVDAVATCIDAP